jgi:hypothetical protein
MVMKIVRILRLRSALHLLSGEHCRQRVLDAAKGDLLGELLVAQCGTVEEAQGSDDRIDRRRFEATRHELQSVVADVFEAQLVGGLPVELGEVGNGIGVDLLGVR